MSPRSRIFEKEALIKTQGQYEPRAKTLKLLRWRLVIDGVEGAWRLADPKKSTGGWPMTLKISDLPPGPSADEPGHKKPAQKK
jgi:hypothetical protein